MTLEDKRKQIEKWSDEAAEFEYGKEVNLEKAFELYKKCAEYYDVDPGCEDAAACLEDVGKFYYEGLGPVALDYSEAIKWYEKALKANELDMHLVDLAEIYEHGWGTEVNLEKASEVYLHSRFVYHWKRAYNIYHTGKINNPAKENEIRYSECKNNAIYFYDLLEKNIVSLSNIREGLL